MGCGATKEFLERNEEEYSANKIALQSTGNLQLLLQQNTLRIMFKNFIETEWIPIHNNDDNFYINHSRNTASNCVDFWIDISDFNRIKPSAFRNYRAIFLYEKYLMHGATKQVCSVIIV